MQDFRKLKVWEEAHRVALDVYRITQHFPKEETYGLKNQLRRAATSVPTNLAEGTGRGTDRDFGRFLQFAMGSACETEYLILLSRELGYIGEDESVSMIDKLTVMKRMLNKLIQKLKIDHTNSQQPIASSNQGAYI
jgi:four helix bundle protein